MFDKDLSNGFYIYSDFKERRCALLFCGATIHITFTVISVGTYFDDTGKICCMFLIFLKGLILLI